MQVALNWRTVVRAFVDFQKRGTRRRPRRRLEAVEVPNSWLFIGLVPITIGLVIVQYFAFHIAVWLGLVSVAFSFVRVARVLPRDGRDGHHADRRDGQGHATALRRAARAPKASPPSISWPPAPRPRPAGAAADLLTDLKSGYLLGANPRRQFLAQFYGVFFGVVAVVPAWYSDGAGQKGRLEAFNPPATNMWKAVADLLTQGVNHLPHTALMAIVIGALVGMALPVAEKLWPKAKPYLPSAMGLGSRWVVPFQNAFSFLIGAVIVTVWQKCTRKLATLLPFRLPPAWSPANRWWRRSLPSPARWWAFWR